MPGFTIHIAVAKQYANKHKLEIKNEEEFIKGAIAPDLNENMTQIASNKKQTHYGIWGDFSLRININPFLEDTKVNIEEDFWKGYLLHLLTDFYFYKKYFYKETIKVEENNDKFYYDYNCLNKAIIDKYQLSIKPNIKKYTYILEGKPKYLNLEKVIEFIEEISSIDLESQIQIIKQNGLEGLM